MQQELPARPSFTPFSADDVERLVPHRFETRAAEDGQRLAVRTPHASISYGELDTQANRLAHLLLRVAPSQAVALLLTDPIARIAAMLAALKAGKYFFVLDAEWPLQHLRNLLDQHHQPVLLAERATAAMASRLQDGVQTALVDELTAEPDTSPSTARMAHDLALVIYTSGSTGQPQGVMYSHTDLLHFVRCATNRLRIAASDRLLGMGSSTSIMYVATVFQALLNGASLHWFDPGEFGLRALARWLRREAISMFLTNASLFRSFVRELEAGESFGGVRLVRLGGEPLFASDVTSFRRHFPPPAVLVNGYGTTETGLLAYGILSHDAPMPDNLVPIGYTFEGIEVSLDGPQPSSDGTRSGELMVKSAYLPRGYWRDAERTARDFIPMHGAVRCFRTRDVVRMSADGCMTHLGRADSLIKIRGQRVSPLEVEAALLHQPSIAEACVVGTADENGVSHLVAFVVDNGRGGDIKSWKASLRALLPAHQLPSRLVRLDTMPRTSSGKCDLDRLRRRAGELMAEPADSGRDRAPLPARDPLEAIIVALFEKHLALAEVGRDDDFFELGGHSLLAASLVSELESVCGQMVPLSALHGASTPASLAARLLQQSPCGELVTPLGQAHSPHAESLYFFHGDIYGGGFYTRQIATHLGLDMASYVVHPHGLDGGPIPASIEQMADDYMSRIVALQPRGLYHLAGYCAGGVVAFEVAQRMRALGMRVGSLLLIDSRTRYGRGRLVEAASRVCSSVLRLASEAWERRPADLRNVWSYWRRHPVLAWRGALNSIRNLAQRALRWWRPRPAADSVRARQDAVFGRHFEALCRYRPGRYDGDLTLVRTFEMWGVDPLDATVGWRRLARRVHTRHLPGGHLTSVTRYVAIFSRFLREALRPQSQ
jgi:amino acid adenylation domain-containing protein